MIGKVAASGSGFRGVINYILLGKKDAPNPDRVAWTLAHNLLSDDPDLAPALMRATANQSVRCRKPVYHLAISWHRDEDPSDDLMREVGVDTLRDLELAEHQALFVAHKDTAHKHLHLIINRVHPETGRAWSNSNDYKRIEMSLRKQAEARGLPYVPGRFNDPERFAGKGRAVKDGEMQAALRHGKAGPKPAWGRDDIKALRTVLASTVSGARSWEDLHVRVAALGLRLSPKGQGLIIEGADGFLKLSDLGKDVRVRSLEAAFGETFDTFSGRAAVSPPAALRSGRDALGTAPTRGIIDAEAELAAARQDLAEVIDDTPRREAADSVERTQAPPPARQPTTRQPHPSTAPLPSAKRLTPEAAAARSDAFTMLRAARQAEDMADALFEAGLITRDELDAATADVRRASDALRPHLSLEEQLKNDIADALRGKPGKPRGPDRGGPMR
ncbi:MAG: relaxase/mobilization nuclease domain-containing protein [Proteobacteria bacterium]|nr:relaxase/mobilization nuclease domain-containing protein [Pseudomonadota bacterium]